MWVVIFQISSIAAVLQTHCNQNFVDSQGLSCEDYEDNNYCDEDGGYGYNWNNSAAPHGLISGTFLDYSVNSESALYCPECGCKDEYTDASDPYAVLYEHGRVQEIYIAMDLDDWDELRMQGGSNAIFWPWFVEDQCYKEPVGTDYDWFRANITWNGETLVDCGVRKKGFYGSVVESGMIKPSLKIDTDEFVDDQEFGGWLERFTLNNNIQSHTINQCLGYRLFRSMGLSAPRCNLAKVYVNDKYKGLYSNVEPVKKAFLRHNFNNYDDGNLYEGTVGDFETDVRGMIEKKNNEGDDDWSDIDQVIDALDAGSYDDLAEILNLEKFFTFWSAEVILGHVDGYANNMNNFYLYLSDDGKFEFIPWGADALFMAVKYWELSRMSLDRSVMVKGRIAHFLYTQHQDLFVREIEKLLSSDYWNVTQIHLWAKELTEITLAHGSGYDYGDHTDSFPVSDYEDELMIISNWVSSRRDILLGELLPTPVEWDTEWNRGSLYDILCLGGWNRTVDPSNCIWVTEVSYSSKGDCENGEGNSSTIPYEWANNCDEVKQVYNDMVTDLTSHPEVDDFGMCVPDIFSASEIEGIYKKYDCFDMCSGDEDTGNEDTDEHTSATLAIIIGLVVGGLLTLVILFIWCWHRKQMAAIIQTQHSPTPEGTTGKTVL